MCVDQRVDLSRRWHSPTHRLQHLLGQRKVVKRVHEQRALAVYDEPSVAPSPAPIGL
jgi:hypothetical protein